MNTWNQNRLTARLGIGYLIISYLEGVLVPSRQ